MKKLTRGFTLIELLVVIAIIGVLASVVLASLNSARSKGEDAAVKSNLANARPQAELFYDNAGTYTGLCADANIAQAVTQSGATCQVLADGSAWALEAPLNTGFWCVDSTGTAEAQGASSISATDAVCG